MEKQRKVSSRLSKRRSQSKKRKTQVRPEPGFDARRLVENLASFRPLGALLCVLAVLGGVVFGLEILKKHVQANPEFTSTDYQVVLDNPPDWVVQERWESRILDCAREVIEQDAIERLSEEIELPAPASTTGTRQVGAEKPIAERIHDALLESGWVRQVHRIVAGHDGVIRIEADYRRPVAMIQFNDEQDRERYVAVDGEGVCLPELYERVEPDSGWIRIFGVQERPTFEDDRAYQFQGKDALAGIRLARELGARAFDKRPYWHYINGITVLNYGGRQRRDDAHIKLLRRDGGIPVIWGSAIGDEIINEEPDWRAKLRTLGLALQHGVKGAYDLSVYANGIVVQKPDS